MALKKIEISFDISAVDSGSVDKESPVYKGLLDGFKKELSEMNCSRGIYHLRIIDVKEK